MVGEIGAVESGLCFIKEVCLCFYLNVFVTRLMSKRIYFQKLNFPHRNQRSGYPTTAAALHCSLYQLEYIARNERGCTWYRHRARALFPFAMKAIKYSQTYVYVLFLNPLLRLVRIHGKLYHLGRELRVVHLILT